MQTTRNQLPQPIHGSLDPRKNELPLSIFQRRIRLHVSSLDSLLTIPFPRKYGQGVPVNSGFFEVREENFGWRSPRRDNGLLAIHGCGVVDLFNNERPHEGLDMKCPAEVYQPSTRPYQGLPDIDYPFHDKTIVVTRCGRICLGKKKINFSQVFAGQAVGIKEVHDDIWLVSFMDYDLGYFDLETRVLEPLENPFGPKVLRMS